MNLYKDSPKAVISAIAESRDLNRPKDQIEVCSDCEFRRICIDFRVPQKRADGSLWFRIECDYNPYIGKWKGEPGYLSLGECGLSATANGFSIDWEKLNHAKEISGL